MGDGCRQLTHSHDLRHASQCGLRLLQRLLRPLVFGDVDKTPIAPRTLPSRSRSGAALPNISRAVPSSEYHGDFGFANFLSRAAAL
jgi:hypothetical protein